MAIYMVLEKQVCQSVNWNTISVLLSWYPMHMYFEHAYYIQFTFVWCFLRNWKEMPKAIDLCNWDT